MFIRINKFFITVDEDLPPALHETVYTIEYQGLRLIALNSCDEIAVQTDYLETQLKKDGARWVVVSFHHPIFAPGGRTHYTPEDREAWRKLFNRYNVDLVLQGHDHSYLRGQVPTLDPTGKAGSDFQTMYVTAVSGPKQYPTNIRQLAKYETEHFTPVRRAENTQFFQVIEVEGNQLIYKAYTATGDLYDRAVISKDGSTGKKEIQQDFEGIPQRTMTNTAEYTKKDL